MSKLQDPRVLIVDDQAATRTLLGSILRKTRINIVGEARSGEETVQKVERDRANVVFLDIHMGELDGLSTLSRLREDYPETAVIMVTGSATRETVTDALKRGAAGFVSKPFNAKTVLETLKRVIQDPRPLKDKRAAATD